MIGLSHVRVGEHGKDDLLFDFQTGKFKQCSIEIKGSKNGLFLALNILVTTSGSSAFPARP